MSTIDDEGSGEQRESIGSLVRKALQKDRGYASYWKWPCNRDLEEVNIARVLVLYLQQIEDLKVVRLGSRGRNNDPPDCEAVLADGSVFGIEITEIVNEKAVTQYATEKRRQHNEQVRRTTAVKDPRPGPYAVADWTPENLDAAIRKRLRDKDVPLERLKGGPYARYLVAMATDESIITLDFAQHALASAMYETSSIDEAYLMLSYHPVDGRGYPEDCPIVRLPVRRRIP